MKRKDILRKLEERLARGEINEKTYLEIKARYESEPEEPEELGEAELPNVDFAATIGNAVAQATADASRAAGDAARAVGEAMRAMDFSGIGAGTKLSDEAIKIVGSGVVSGNPVKTVEFRSAGSARVQGSLIAEVARVAGACSFEGDVQVEEFRSAGSVRIAGNLNAETIESSGSLQVEGSIKAEEVSLSGSLQVKGRVQAEEFRSSGSVRIDQGLTAEEVEIDLGGTSKIPTIEGESVRVKATGGFFRIRGELTAESIQIIGKKSTAAKRFRVMQEDEGKGIIRIDGLVRRNVGVSLGDKIEVRKAEVLPAERITIAPIISEGHKISFGQGIENFVKRGLLKRPLNKGDVVIVPGIALMGGALPFMVISTAPKGIVQIQDDTIIEMKEEPVREGEVLTPTVTYEDIGGLKEELMKVREMIELPLKHAELFERLGIDPPKGVLLYGPPGTGKTLIAKAVANEAGANFYSIQGPEIMSKYYGQSEERLREKFEEAQKNAPSVLFIDELDSIAPKREEVTGEVERRVVAQLLTLMDGLSGRGQVIVIGATNRDEAIDPALRRPGRFDREIEIGVPDRSGRKEILQIHTRGMPIEGVEEERDHLLSELADVCHGFVGADLAALAREAAMKALRRYLPDIDLDKPIPAETLEKMRVLADDFKQALKEVEPSAMREVLVEVPRVNWADVGGLEEVKMKLREAVEMPLKDPEAFKRMGIRPPRGILLYGPPGSGKTLLAKAVATESEANFISIKGPEVMSKWVGESEKAVRMIFKKAKQVAPCIVFLDELDAVAHVRGFDTDSGVSERVVNQLLTSMDGLETLEGVCVIGATNRPDRLDPAMLRTGRFDRILLVPTPNRDARLAILKVHTKGMPLEGVDLEELAVDLDGYSGADIEGLCRESAMIALRETKHAKKVTMVHFQEAIKVVRPSIDADTIKFYEEFDKKFKKGVDRGRREENILYR